MRYYCSCLNIQIDTLHNDADPQQLQSVDSIPFFNAPDQWLERQFLSEQSIHIQWQSLSHTIPLRDMQIHRCLNCNQYTHIINYETNRLLINRDLYNDYTVKQLYSSPNYSKVIKIILPNGNESLGKKDLSGAQDEVCQHECQVAQQLYRETIEKADQETEEKIRAYQKEQEDLLARNIAKTNKELSVFLNFIRAMPRSSSNIKTSPVRQNSISYINENSMESGFGSDIFESNGSQHWHVERTLSERSDYLDEDSESLSTSATSLPKDVSSHSYVIPEQISIENDEDLERIGKSFRDLSQSFTWNDGTELFGDLPSPRLSTRPT